MNDPDLATSHEADEPVVLARGHGRVRAALEESRRVLRMGLHDPEHLAERLTLYGARHLAPPSLEWAQDIREQEPSPPIAAVADELRTRSARVARIDGAISGTPFLLAFIPGYLAYLWQEGRMILRTAALYGRDPASLETSAEVLTLRGVHPTVDAARAALLEVRDTGLSEKRANRRPLRTWVQIIYSILIFGGFLSPPSDDAEPRAHGRLKTAVGMAVGGIVWVMTWVLPVTFMILMSWGCESHTRELGRRALSFYGGEVDSPEKAIGVTDTREDEGHNARAIARSVLLFLSVAVPIAFIAITIHVTNNAAIGWLTSLGALVAVSLVIATSVLASRR